MTDRLPASLASVRLVNRRTERYDGDAMGVPIAGFPAALEEAMRDQYARLGEVLARLRRALALPAGDGTPASGFRDGSPDRDAGGASGAALDAAREALRATAADASWVAMLRAMRAVADGHLERTLPPLAVKALHDIRGGAFQALVLTIQMAEHGLDAPADAVRAFYLARDHLKIMRNALPDLDAESYARDAAQRDHGVQLLLEKWNAGVHRVEGGAAARVSARSGYDGAISTRCLEFSSLDRVLYNLMNNATRHAADGAVRLDVDPVQWEGDPGDRASDDSPHDLRFVVRNGLTRAQRETLLERFPDGLAPLFEGGFTTGGTGVGLSVCAEIVAHAYGIASPEDAVRGGYVGAAADDEFVAWFHWPTVD